MEKSQPFLVTISKFQRISFWLLCTRDIHARYSRITMKTHFCYKMVLPWLLRAVHILLRPRARAKKPWYNYYVMWNERLCHKYQKKLVTIYPVTGPALLSTLFCPAVQPFAQ